MNEQKLRELVAKWRSEAERADRTAKKPSIGRRLEGNAYRVCADELESALADCAEALAENFLRDCPDCEQEIAAPPSTERSRALEFHKQGPIPVNAPTCEKCGKIFLDCQCAASAVEPQGFEEWWERTGIIGNGPLKPAALAAWNAASAARLREKAGS